MIINHIKEILEKHHSIGILVSGGFDSALLLYMLYLYKSTNKITAFVVDYPNKSLEYSKKVLDYIDPDITVHHFKNIPNINHVRYGVTRALAFPVDIILIADTANPAHLIGYDRPVSTNIRVIQPFIKYTKDVVVSTAKQLDALSLLDITWSCETNNIVPCGECFHCKERAWALL